MFLKFKKLDEAAVIPSRAHESDAGLDLVATSLTKADEYWEYGTGLAASIPRGMVGLLFPRSSISKTSHSLRNSVGVVDSGYRGEIKLRMSVPSGKSYEVGDKIGQLVIFEMPLLDIDEVDELESSERDEGGFGSTGN